MSQLESYNRIYITGFMGSGKSTIGPMVANRLGWDFQDLDHRIIDKIGTSIATFFEREGEQAFRELEFTALEETAQVNQTVIALVGGALCSDRNLSWTLNHGCIVYLEVSTGFLVGRLRKEQHKRPMLLDDDGQPLDKEGVTERISSLLYKRIPYYSQAQITVNTDGKSIPKIAREIVGRLSA